jgi:hypothetical protein
MVIVTLRGLLLKETEAMLSRCWGLAIVGFFLVSLAPASAQTYDKEAVKALSKRIDEHLAKTRKKAGVSAAPKAEDHVFFRRLNLDLAGRIPDLLHITDFIDDDSPDKRWMWVDKLLDGNDHPRHFANVWRTIMLGYQTNQQFQFLTPNFESWIQERVEKNVGLDKMVLQLLTSTNNNPQFNPGMGRAAPSPALFFQANENKAENLASATSRVFLGIKIECAQCHPHPFAKWSKEQFWEFAAFYSTIAPIRRPPVVGKQPQPAPGYTPGREILIPGTDKVVKAKYLNGKLPDWDAGNSPRKTLADWVTSPDNPYFARAMADHIWSYLMGVSLLEPIMEPSDDSPVTHPELLDDMAKALIDNGFDAKFLIRAIVHTEAYQRSSGGTKMSDKEDYHLFVRMPIRSLSPEQIFDNVSMATSYKDTAPYVDPRQVFQPGQLQSPRQQFLGKFQNQDRRHEPQTSILQALFLMNGKFMAERTKFEKNEDLQTLAMQKTGHDKRINSLYMMVLSRPARPNEIARLTPYLEREAAIRTDEFPEGRLGHALSDIYWALLNSSEFLLNH